MTRANFSSSKLGSFSLSGKIKPWIASELCLWLLKVHRLIARDVQKFSGQASMPSICKDPHTRLQGSPNHSG